MRLRNFVHPGFRQIICLLFLLSASASFAFAQQDDVLNVDTTLVRLNIGVVDKQGNPITNLARPNFTVYEDNVKQDVLRFEPTVAPFSVILLLDSSGSTLSLRQIITQSALRFLDALAPEDRVAVVTFNDKNDVLSDFTTNRRSTAYAVSLVGDVKRKGKTQLYKALDFALAKLQKEGKRRKAIVLLTDGIDTTLRDEDRPLVADAKSNEEAIAALKPAENRILRDVLNTADREGVTVYPLALPSGDPKKLADPTPAQVGMFSAARARLEILAQHTGGNLSVINRLEDMGKIYAIVAGQIRALYSIDYQSSNDKPGSGEKWRKIRVEVNQPEVIAVTRPGYYVK